MIYKFQPFSTTKELGKEYNAHCEIVPGDDDWIMLLDYDAQILIPETYRVIERAIERHPTTTIFGAMTNRIGYSWQRLGARNDDNDRIIHHVRIAKHFAEKYSEGECVDAKFIAGFFLLFRKAYWRENKFQDAIIDANGRMFDYNFCLPAYKEKREIRIIRGAYLWHSYRITHDNTKDKSHLI